jgi:hypothetical protein
VLRENACIAHTLQYPVSANSVDSVAFWKKTYKYTAPDAPEVLAGAEVISTAKFEAYFPTRIRNRAPQIEMSI